jgi:hypothetical protein
VVHAGYPSYPQPATRKRIASPAAQETTVADPSEAPAEEFEGTRLIGGRNTSGRAFRWEGRIVAVIAGASVTDSARLSGTNKPLRLRDGDRHTVNPVRDWAEVIEIQLPD